jgi:hypothetical protein
MSAGAALSVRAGRTAFLKASSSMAASLAAGPPGTTVLAREKVTICWSFRVTLRGTRIPFDVRLEAEGGLRWPRSSRLRSDGSDRRGCGPIRRADRLSAPQPPPGAAQVTKNGTSPRLLWHHNGLRLRRRRRQRRVRCDPEVLERETRDLGEGGSGDDAAPDRALRLVDRHEGHEPRLARREPNERGDVA